MPYCATANPGRVRRWGHKSQSELGTLTYPLKLSGMEALRRRVERLSRTAGTLTVRLAPALPGRSLTDASTAARSIHSDQLGILIQTRILAEKGLTQETVDIFRDHGAAWRRANAGHVSLDQMKVMSAVERCRTAALGGHVARAVGLYRKRCLARRCGEHASTSRD
jgi:hypothetical protein